MALLALVLGMCPLVTPAMMLQHLCNHYGIAEDLITVRRMWPDDFIIRFSRQQDLDHVLGSPEPQGAPFVIRWHRWSHLIMGSAGTFHYRALVGMKGIPLQA
jgi:hypothetical protein